MSYNGDGDFVISKNKGFTLLELMIVIVLLGILAAIAIPQLIAYQKRAYDSIAYSDANNFYKACVSASMVTEENVRYNSGNLPPGYTGSIPKSGSFTSPRGHHGTVSCNAAFKHNSGTKTYTLDDAGSISVSP
jgi:type IV pilus assembly protein PilA